MIWYLVDLIVRAIEDLTAACLRVRDRLAERFGFELSVTVNGKTRVVRFGKLDR